MNNLEFLSKERIETTIRILEQVKNQGGELDLTRFSTLEVDRLEQVHPCGNSACIMGYVSLSKEWEEAGGATERGVPMLKVPEGEWNYSSRKELASLWFTGKDITVKSLLEVNEGERTLAVVLAEAMCLLLEEDELEDLSGNMQRDLLNLLPEVEDEELWELNDRILHAITGMSPYAVDIDDAIKALNWLLTLEITK